jgi:hypothetical protein
MPKQRPSSLFHTRTNLGTFKTQVNQTTCKSGKPTTDGSRCSDTPVIPSRMRMESTLLLRTMKMLLSEPKTTTPGQDGMSDMLRMNKLIKLVSSIQNSVSIAETKVRESSTLSQREMAE